MADNTQGLGLERPKKSLILNAFVEMCKLILWSFVHYSQCDREGLIIL